MVVLSLLLLLLLLHGGSAAATSGRTELSFDYNWRYALGDPPAAQPPLTVAALDESFTAIANGSACTQLSWSQLGRMGAPDCRGACSATPGCLAWQFRSNYGCYIHDGLLGAQPRCRPPDDPEAPPTGIVGGMRSVVPPPLQNRTGVSFKEPGFNDSGWQAVDAPHDFILGGNGEDTAAADYPYSESADSHHGFIPRDRAAWYRKRFALPSNWSVGETWLHFEGVFQAVDVFVNGRWLLRHTSGYLPFDVRLDAPEVHFRGKARTNVISLRVDASFGSGHWYEGGGLQRRVWLLHTPGVARFATHGLFAQRCVSAPPAQPTHTRRSTDKYARTIGCGSEHGHVSAAAATVVPTAEVSASAAMAVVVRYSLHAPHGHTLAPAAAAAAAAVSTTSTLPTHVKPGATVTIVGGANTTLHVTSPMLWSVKAPKLYTLVALLLASESGEVLDSLNTTIGLRRIDWSSGPRFMLNEQPLHIRGFAHHSDFGTGECHQSDPRAVIPSTCCCDVAPSLACMRTLLQHY
jgi:hypothetical protein